MKEPRWNPFVALGKLLFALVLIGVVLAFMAGAVLWGIIKAIWPFLVVAGVVGPSCSWSTWTGGRNSG